MIRLFLAVLDKNKMFRSRCSRSSNRINKLYQARRRAKMLN